jgi:hypothetical protein
MLKRLALGVILGVHLWAIAWGAEAPGKPLVDGARTKSYVAYLSSDAMEGRMTCTDGYRKAAEWVAANFKEWGLQPAGENGTYFQNVPGIRDLDWNTGVPALSIGPRAFLLDDGDFQVDTMSTPGVSCQAEVVFVGYGIVAPDKGLNEYGGVDAKGKVVLAFTGSPKDAPAARQMFDRGKPEATAESKPEETWENESTDLSKIKAAYDQGAAAILLFDRQGGHQGGQCCVRRGRPADGRRQGAVEGAGRQRDRHTTHLPQ